LWLTLPLAGCVEDFHLPVTSVATTAKLVALARNAPCLAHQKKNPHREIRVFFTRKKTNYLILPSL
ncbi:hypothetical protein, partial [Pseudomonas gessardii]|uniref:hypothetical protein n=1 Tax=Pseudomonas gessardii TaxID=78544 RepID=UPI001CA46DB0